MPCRLRSPLTGNLRTLLALAFVSPGLTKVVGNHFVNPVDPTVPIGQLPAMAAFFEAFHSTGVYYSFVGAAQVFRCASAAFAANRTAGGGVDGIGVLLASALGRPSPSSPFSTTRGSSLRTQEPALWDLAVPHSAERPARSVLRAAFVLGFATTMGFLLTIRGHFGTTPSSQAIIQPLFFAALASIPVAVLGWTLWWWTQP